MNAFKELTQFLKYSAKRKHILLEQFKNDEESDNLLADSGDMNELIPIKHKRRLPVLSDTRWLTRVDSIHCLLTTMGHCVTH